MSESGGSQAHEHSFADVLNGLGKVHRRSRAADVSVEPSAEQLSIPWLATSSSPDERDGTEAQWPVAIDDWGEPEDFASAVRPYTWTRGRTRPVYDLAIEALVSTTEQGGDIAALNSVEHRAVAELCRCPRSVAEVAALLGLPLGVARVLLGDMANIGLIAVHRTANSSGGVPEFGFMERVLSGLRRL